MPKPNLRSSNVGSTLRMNCFAWRTYIGQRGGFCAAWKRRRTSRMPSAARGSPPGGGLRSTCCGSREWDASRGGASDGSGAGPGCGRGGRRIVAAQMAVAVGELDEHVPPVLAHRHVTGGGQLLREVAEAADAVGALGERRVELQQRALQQPELRRDFAIAQHLQRAPHQRHDLLDRRLRRHRPLLAAAAIGAPPRARPGSRRR